MSRDLRMLYPDLRCPAPVPRYGAIGSFIPTAAISVAAQWMQEGKVSPLALSIVTIGQNMGILLGPTLFGLVLE